MPDVHKLNMIEEASDRYTRRLLKDPCCEFMK